MKKIVAVSVGVLMMAGSAFGSTKQEKAEELLALMNTQAMFDSMYDQTIPQVTCELEMTPAEEEEFKKEFMEILDIQSLMHTFSQFWIQNYTDKELDQVLAFYKTDAGKKTIELMPQYMQFAMTEGQKWGQDKGPKFMELGKKYAQKYPKRSQDQKEICIKSKMGM
ncbi:MAG: DUF2059 domain-containing protein [Alphaproteobacteria bacterium]|nr:DUF2059 domain-containing protein [Alphaproteobacteria bacterium]